MRNERPVDDWPWRQDGPPPVTEQLTRDFPFYAGQRTIARLMKNSGGTCLLSGVGGDHFFPTTAHQIADLAWQGRLREASRELYCWTLLKGESLARTVVRDLIGPLCSPVMRFEGPLRADRARVDDADVRNRVCAAPSRAAPRPEGPPLPGVRHPQPCLAQRRARLGS